MCTLLAGKPQRRQPLKRGVRFMSCQRQARVDSCLQWGPAPGIDRLYHSLETSNRHHSTNRRKLKFLNKILELIQVIEYLCLVLNALEYTLVGKVH